MVADRIGMAFCLLQCFGSMYVKRGAGPRDAAKRTVMAASRFLGMHIFLSFALGHCKSGGCIKAALVICQHVFSVLALVIFL